MNDIHHIVIGTAGHIDHGKSSLIRWLTGIDPDRLKEEKERGLTIDLGFAPLELPDGKKVGIIDVPGHEKFIKNMVAGATSIDFVILVVAADDGVMPQTREHVEIMQILNLQKGMIVLTKIDKVSEDLVELALEEIEEFREGTFLQNAPIVPVSTVTEVGMEEFARVLYRSISQIEQHSPKGVFRMPIQRVFSSHGHGTVITGVPVSGKAKIGDVIEILPGSQRGRIKKIQAYGKEESQAQAGHSSAINVKDIDYKKVERGQVAVIPGYFQSARFLEGKFTYSSSARRPLTHHTPVRFHTGTSESMGKLAILGKQELQPGEWGYVQVRLEHPVLAAAGDYFVVRLSSPMITIGGGVIIGSGERKLKRFRGKVIEELEKREQTLSKVENRVELELKLAGFVPVKEEQMLKISHMPVTQLRELLAGLIEQKRIFEIKGHFPRYIHPEVLGKLEKRVIAKMHEFYAQFPHRVYMNKLSIQKQLEIDNNLWELLLERLIGQETLAIKGQSLFIPKREVLFSNQQKRTLQEIEQRFLSNLFTPPRPDELPQIVNKPQAQVAPLLEYLIESEIFVEVAQDIVFHDKAILQARQLVVKTINDKGELTAADFRDRLQTTRKYIIPLLEYFDRNGLTVRKGNIRVLKNHSDS